MSEFDDIHCLAFLKVMELTHGTYLLEDGVFATGMKPVESGDVSLPLSLPLSTGRKTEDDGAGSGRVVESPIGKKTDELGTPVMTESVLVEASDMGRKTDGAGAEVAAGSSSDTGRKSLGGGSKGAVGVA